MKDRTMVSTMCPICRCPAKRKIRWFSTNNSKVYYSLALCHEHGPVAGKIRIRKTDEGKYFGVKTLRAEDTEAADEIREKHESLRRQENVTKSGEDLIRCFVRIVFPIRPFVSYNNICFSDAMGRQHSEERPGVC